MVTRHTAAVLAGRQDARRPFSFPPLDRPTILSSGNPAVQIRARQPVCLDIPYDMPRHFKSGSSRLSTVIGPRSHYRIGLMVPSLYVTMETELPEMFRRHSAARLGLAAVEPGAGTLRSGRAGLV